MPLPAAVASGTVPVGRTADVLFFLHATTGTAKGKEPPTVGTYTVKYADGQSVEVPVKLGEGVAHWKSPAAGLKAASVAWTDGTRALYALPWTNPRPTAAVESVSVKGQGLLLLAVTAGTGR